jgi:pimeloyl-ACP methyl ester carboxylesterase
MQYKEKTFLVPWYINFWRFQYIPKHNITYLEYGEHKDDRPSVVCVHGLARNAHDFDFVASTLSNSFNMFSVNVVGRGTSSWFENKKLYNFDNYVRDLIYFLKNNNLRGINWIGSSMGGIIGMVIASKEPDLIKNLILNDIGPSIPIAPLSKISFFVSKENIFKTFSEGVEYMSKIFAYFGITDPKDVEYLAKHSLKLNTDGTYVLHYDPSISEGVSYKSFGNNPNANVDLWKYYKNVSCPILVIHGTKSNVLLPETVEQMTQNTSSKDVRVLPVEGCGHTPGLTEKSVQTYIENWLLERN